MSKKRRKVNKKILLTQLFLVSLLFIGIGYSILNTTLGINGTVQLSKKPESTLKKQNDMEVNVTFGKEIARSSFESIEIVDHMNVPTDALDSWDASEEQNESIKAWYTDTDSNGLYELYIGGDKVVYANPDSNWAFQRFTSAKSINVDKLNTSKVEKMDYMFGGNSTNLTSIDVSNFDTSKVTTMAGLFNNCQKLTEIIGLDAFNTSNVTTMNSMFNNCKNLTNIDVSNFDTSSVTTMASMFSNCNNLTNIDVSNFNVEKVTSMNSMFNTCNSLKRLDLKNWVTLSLENFNYMFWDCRSLEYLDMRNFYTKKITSLKDVIPNNSKLLYLNMSNWDTSNVTTMWEFLANMSSIKELDLSSFDTSKVTNMSYLFHGNRSLEKLYISDLWNMDSVTSNSYMFHQTNNLSGDIDNKYTLKPRIVDFNLSNSYTTSVNDSIVLSSVNCIYNDGSAANVSSDSIIWYSSNNGVAKVKQGVITGVSRGDAVITLKSGNTEKNITITVN